MLGDPPEVTLEVEALEVARHLVEVLETLTAEVYRVRVAVEVMAGEALDRALEDHPHPAGAELRHLGRLGVDLNLEGP